MGDQLMEVNEDQWENKRNVGQNQNFNNVNNLNNFNHKKK
jgi:hypothetical protein